MDAMADRGKGRDARAIRITTAAPSRELDTAGRQRRYLYSMAVRTACFVGAVFVGPGWLRWVLVAGAALLPYVAVIAANNIARRHEELALPGVPVQVRSLSAPDDALS